MAPRDFKASLHRQCMKYATQRIDTARVALNYAQESANAEDKSSAGDKYETGRAMAHLEREKALEQLNEATKLKSAMEKMSLTYESDRVRLGSIVFTDTHNFYLAISAGKLIIHGVEFLTLTPASPLGVNLMGLKKGDRFIFNKQTLVIAEIQ
jgi:transcription elongation GreA/GreB family factor